MFLYFLTITEKGDRIGLDTLPNVMASDTFP